MRIDSFRHSLELPDIIGSVAPNHVLPVARVVHEDVVEEDILSLGLGHNLGHELGSGRLDPLVVALVLPEKVDVEPGLVLLLQAERVATGESPCLDEFWGDGLPAEDAGAGLGGGDGLDVGGRVHKVDDEVMDLLGRLERRCVEADSMRDAF